MTATLNPLLVELAAQHQVSPFGRGNLCARCLLPMPCDAAMFWTAYASAMEALGDAMGELREAREEE